MAINEPAAYPNKPFNVINPSGVSADQAFGNLISVEQQNSAQAHDAAMQAQQLSVQQAENAADREMATQQAELDRQLAIDEAEKARKFQDEQARLSERWAVEAEERARREKIKALRYTEAVKSRDREAMKAAYDDLKREREEANRAKQFLNDIQVLSMINDPAFTNEERAKILQQFTETTEGIETMHEGFARALTLLGSETAPGKNRKGSDVFRTDAELVNEQIDSETGGITKFAVKAVTSLATYFLSGGGMPIAAGTTGVTGQTGNTKETREALDTGIKNTKFDVETTIGDKLGLLDGAARREEVTQEALDDKRAFFKTIATTMGLQQGEEAEAILRAAFSGDATTFAATLESLDEGTRNSVKQGLSVLRAAAEDLDASAFETRGDVRRAGAATGEKKLAEAALSSARHHEAQIAQLLENLEAVGVETYSPPNGERQAEIINGFFSKVIQEAGGSDEIWIDLAENIRNDTLEDSAYFRLLSQLDPSVREAMTSWAKSTLKTRYEGNPDALRRISEEGRSFLGADTRFSDRYTREQTEYDDAQERLRGGSVLFGRDNTDLLGLLE